MKRLLILSIILLATGLPAQSLRLVDDGEARAVIVLAAKPSAAATMGAKILSDHLFQISGARLKTVKEDQVAAADSVLIFVGASQLSAKLGAQAGEFGPGEILIKSYPNALVLLGADDPLSSDANGTRYAVTTFLEDRLGVRFLWPGELGKIVPRSQTIDIEPIDHRFSPLLRQRRIRMAGGFGTRMAKGGERLAVDAEDYNRFNKAAAATRSTDAGWAGWHRLGGSLRLMSGHSMGHMWEKYGKEHPEWFAMAPNGSRDQSNSPHRARLCVSNPELIAAIAQERIEQINQTKQKSVSIGPNDGGTTTFCTCPQCEAWDAPSARKIKLIDFSPGANRRQFDHVPLTDRYVRFWNGIAERVVAVHPDTWLTADAYSVYSAPPVKAKLHPNIAIRYVGVSYTKEEKRRQNLADWNEWAKAASKIYFRSNLLLAGRRQGTPVVYIHKLAKDFRSLAPNRMIGTDLDSCCHNWATQGLNYYVMGKLLWNPNLNIDDLLADYCQTGFGAGAKPVKSYFLQLEELTNQIADGQLGVTEPFTSDNVSKLRGLLEEAGRLTRDDPESGRRVAFLRTGLEYTDAYANIFHIFREWQADGGRLQPEMRERFKVFLDRNWENSRDIFENHHFAVNVANVAWGSWGYFGRFGWRGPSEELLKKWQGNN
jgi:hypothetical protein